MSFARDYLQELKKIDPNTALRVEHLDLDPAENMLIASIILFSSGYGYERNKLLNRLLIPSVKVSKEERLQTLYYLVHNKKCEEQVSPLDFDYHQYVKKLLCVMNNKHYKDPIPKGLPGLTRFGTDFTTRYNSEYDIFYTNNYQTNKRLRKAEIRPFTTNQALPGPIMTTGSFDPNRRREIKISELDVGHRGGIYCSSCGFVHTSKTCPFLTIKHTGSNNTQITLNNLETDLCRDYF